MPPALRILALSEDSAHDAHAVLIALAKSMLKIVERGVDTRPVRLQFDEAREEARRATRANFWRSTSEEHEPYGRALKRAIVEYLLMVDDDNRPAGFVFFHDDGDEPFSNAEKSDARRHWKEFRHSIEQQLRAVCPRADKSAIEQMLKRLIAIEPFYCIEAWTYQHTEVAKAICLHGCGRHQAEFDAWARNRGRLDEIKQPWNPKQLDSCLRKDYNLALTGSGYPADDVWQVGKSYYCTVERMGDCDDLVDALKRTRSS
jgi:hypothetical protein